MTASVFRLPAATSFNVEQALNSALQENLSDVLVMGYDADGVLFIRSSRMTCAEAAFLAEKAKEWAMTGGHGR
jgi:hypothetical protein